MSVPDLVSRQLVDDKAIAAGWMCTPDTWRDGALPGRARRAAANHRQNIGI